MLTKQLRNGAAGRQPGRTWPVLNLAHGQLGHFNSVRGEAINMPKASKAGAAQTAQEVAQRKGACGSKAV